MKKLILAALLFVAFAAQAQQPATRSGAVSGQIVDGATSKALESAFVEFRSVADTTFVRRDRALPDGKFTVSGLPYGEYTVEVSFLGYETYRNKLTVNSRNMTVAAFYMTQTSLVADQVVVVGQMIRVSMHGDTIVYNPKAFKVAEDADAEAVVKQLPGVEVQDGQVTVQGKNVAQILVDGKETYGTDVQETMKTIPAAMLESIEVYEKLSDFAETTGINDGDEYTVMNFKTGIKFAHFGEASAMWGWEDMYAVGARWNIVTGGHRFGLNGGVNNTGATQSFNDLATPGMFGGGGYRGSSRYGGMDTNSKTKNLASGMTYNFEPSDKFRFNTNYRYGKSDSERRGSSDTRYYSNPLYDRLLSTSSSENGNDNHNFGASSRWKIDNRNTVNMRMQGSLTDAESLSTSEQNYFEDAVVAAVQTLSGRNDNNSDSYKMSGQLDYGLKIGSKGRSFRVGLEGSKSNSDSKSFNDTDTERNMPPYPVLDSLGRSRSLSNYNSHNIEWRAEYFEPLSPYMHALISFRGDYTYSDRDSRADMWDYRLPDFDSGKWAEWGSGSGVMNERRSNHRIAPGLNYRKNNNEMQLRVGYTHMQLSGESVLPSVWKDRREFSELYFSLDYEKQFTPQKKMEFSIGSDNNAPGIDQLQNIDEVSTSGLSVYGGNPDLRPSTYYWSSLNYNIYNLRTSSSFSAYMSGHVEFNSVGTNRYTVTENGWTTPNNTALTAGQEYSRPENINRAVYYINAGTYYGRPLKFIKTNFNIGLSANYSEKPGLVNSEKNTARNQSYSLRIRLNSNFSQNLTIGLSYSATPGWVDNTNTKFSDERTLSQNGRLDFYWLTWKNFVLRTNASYTYTHMKQQGKTNDYRYESVMANVALGKKLFKNKRGEITFAINDLFNQNKYNSYYTTNDRVTYTNHRGLGRYYSLSFRYQLRNFSKEARGGRRGQH